MTSFKQRIWICRVLHCHFSPPIFTLALQGFAQIKTVFELLSALAACTGRREKGDRRNWSPVFRVAEGLQNLGALQPLLKPPRGSSVLPKVLALLWLERGWRPGVEEKNPLF